MMRPARETRDDDGFTLIEVLVSLGIMSVVLAVVIAAIAQIYSATTRIDTTTYARDQLTVAFRRLDKEIRYAEWINPPAPVGTRYYFEYALPDGTCRQVKYDSGMLTVYRWTPPASTPGNPQVLANNLALISGTAPFSLYAPNSTPYATASPGTAGVGKNYAPDHYLLRIQVNVVSGRSTLAIDTLFTAENTTRNTPTINDCSNGRPTS